MKLYLKFTSWNCIHSISVIDTMFTHMCTSMHMCIVYVYIQVLHACILSFLLIQTFQLWWHRIVYTICLHQYLPPCLHASLQQCLQLCLHACLYTNTHLFSQWCVLYLKMSVIFRKYFHKHCLNAWSVSLSLF